MHKIAIIVPAYNEAENLAKVIEELIALKSKFDYPIEIVVINDGSTDATLEIASKLDGIVLDLPINLGIGGAVQTGIKYAFENDYDFAVQVDGDGQHPPQEIPKLIKAIQESSSDVVIGSRFMTDEGFKSTLLRRTGIRFFNSLIRLFCGQIIKDCTSGFRIFNQKAMALVSEDYPDEYPEPESILLFAFNGLKVSETPVSMRSRTGGRSSIRRWGAVYYIVKVSLALFFRYIKAWKI